MTFTNPLGLLLLGLAIPVILMHILKPLREARPVSSTYLWQRMDRPVTATAPWQRLTPSWLLALQLIAVIGLALLVANPARVSDAALAQHTVFLVDASGSMSAIDGEPDRLSDAVDRAIEVRSQLPEGGVASVIQVGTVPRVLLTTEADEDIFAEAVRRVRGTDGAADFARAFALAEGLETPDAPIGFVLVSDGGLSPEELRVVPSGLTYEPIGSMATNRALTDLRVEPRGEGVHVEVEISNTGGPTATQTVRIDVDGRTRHSREITLERNESTTIAVDLVTGDRVEAFLEGDDLLAIDDRRWAVTARRSALDVAVIGEGDAFLLAMLESLDGISVSTADSLVAFETAVANGDVAPADVFIFDRVPVPESPGAPFWAIAPPGGVEGIDPIGVVELPIISLVRTDDVLLRDLDLTSVAISETQQVTTTGVDVLVGAEDAPLLMRGRHGGRDFVYLTFAPSASNLPVQLAYPILSDRIVADLGGSALPPSDLVVGQQLRLTADSTVITDPGGRVQTVLAGDPQPVTDRPGYWTLQADGQPAQVVAVNPNTAESSLGTAAAIPSEIRTPRPGVEAPRTERSLRPWIIGGLLVVLIAEWMLARRQVGVSRRQWTASQVLRGIVGALLLAALFNAGFNRTPDRVATVFVLDASDSMGSAGRAEAVSWTQDALREQPDDAVAGVVLFGGDARIESLVQEDLRLGQPAVLVNADQTDLAGALRLAAAILPDDAGRRVILLSDGRATIGDVTDEAVRLGAEGIAVDIHVIGGSVNGDTAVASIDAPAFVRDGEGIEVEATILASRSGETVLTFFRDGETVEAVRVELIAGQNQVAFTDTEPPLGLHRYEVVVTAEGDPVPENNRAFAPVQVGESRGVLIIEGTPGAADVFAAALEAGGTPTTIDEASAIRGPESLVSYDATVLVDVPVTNLTAGQIDALASSVRDTGRGLVTIGGLQSYGLGGYLGSDLEAVLPVISDVLDPQRRQSVAEVIAIDTSGSMGACHCAEGFQGPSRDLGGVTKTDIARAGAARTIAALSPSDEVGVLAFDTQSRWVIDLQTVPADEVVNDALGSLTPDGGTNISSTLGAAADQLRMSSASLKHIILFSDGFTEPGALERLASEAAELLDVDGITISVIATGEGAAEDLRPIAEAGGGRFYPGRDLDRIPEILVEEALLASRDYIVEGEFFPQVTSNDQAVQGLTSSPPLFGYTATSAKPTSSTLLRIGPDGDPLLASWQVGLGTATSWTSDASDRWSQSWADWDGYVAFWNNVVRDTFPSPSGDVETRAQVRGDLLTIEVDSADAFSDGTRALARVTTPSGDSIEVPLDRISPNTFAAEIPADEQGVYAVGTSLDTASGESSVSGTALAARSYSTEYRPGDPDVATLERVASDSGGRFDIEAAAAFDTDNLTRGTSWFSLVPWLLLLAAVLWPVAVAVSRITMRERDADFVREQAADRNAALQLRRRAEPVAGENEQPILVPPPIESSPATIPAKPTIETMPPTVQLPEAGAVRSAGHSESEHDNAPSPDAATTSTLDALLARKRRPDPDE